MTTQPTMVRVCLDMLASGGSGEPVLTIRDRASRPIFSGTARETHRWLIEHGYLWHIGSRGLWWRHADAPAGEEVA